MTLAPGTEALSLPLSVSVLADMPGCYTATRSEYAAHTEFEIVLMPGVEPDDFFPVFSLVPEGATFLTPSEAEVEGVSATVFRYVANII